MSAGSMRGVILSAIGAAGLLSAWALGPVSVHEGSGDLLTAFLAGALSPAAVDQGGNGVALLPLALEAMRETVALASAGVSLSLLIGLPLGLLASSWGASVGARWVVRGVNTLLRSVHELIWAMVLLAAFGRSDLAAVVAIAIPYGGTLAKVFSELIDEAPREAAEALAEAGAGRSQVVAFGVLPQALPDMAAYAFYRFECGLRSSAVLGFFGFPTLGYYLDQSAENLYFAEVWTWLYALLLLVGLADWWSGAIRRRLVR